MPGQDVIGDDHGCVLVQREMDFCLIGVNRKWVTVTNLF